MLPWFISLSIIFSRSIYVCFKWQGVHSFLWLCFICVCVCVRVLFTQFPKLFPTLCEFNSFPWTVAHQAQWISRQKYYIGLAFSTPRNLPDPVIECVSPVSPALAGQFFTTRACEAYTHVYVCVCVYTPRSIHLLMDTWLYDWQEVNIQNM